MKKIFKKLFVIGLVIAVLAPFIDVPAVNAESDCTDHLQNYLFLDVNVLYQGIEDDRGDYVTLFDYYKEGRSINTTIFPYEFPIEENVNITNVEFNQLDETDGDIRNYISLHNRVIAWTADEEQDKYRSYYHTDIYGGSFVTNPASEYSSSSILLHGRWSNLDADFEPIENNWAMINTGSDSDYPFEKYVLQSTPLVDHMETVISRGKINSEGNAVPATGEMDADAFNELVTTDLEELYDEEKLDYMDDVDKYFIPVTIKRTLDSGFSDSSFDDVILGYAAGDTLFVFGYNESDKAGMTCGTASDEMCTIAEASDVENSYDAYKEFIEDGATDTTPYVVQVTSPGSGFTTDKFNEDPTDYDVDYNIYSSYYWPFVLTVEYEMCNYTGGDVGKWTLEYNGNNKNAKDIPEGGDFDYGEDVVLADGPKLDGYKFIEWCTEEDGSGDCYEAGETYEGPDSSTTIELFAQWGKTGNGGADGDLGVFSYIISFLAIGAVSATIYFVSKKKNLFKQI